MRVISNIGTDRVLDILPQGAGLSMATSAATVAGLSLMARHGVLTRLLVSAALGLEEHADDRRTRNALTQRGDAHHILTWAKTAKLRGSDRPLTQSLVMTEQLAGHDVAFVGDCPATSAGLGITRSRSAGLVQMFDDDAEIAAMRDWFERQWREASRETAPDLIQDLERVAAAIAPADAYHRALGSLFADMAETDTHLPDRAMGLEESGVWQKLYRFQRDGVLGAIAKLRQWGGCIIADSVGLGKTFEALAVIRYYELRNERVLVLAPKRLRDNWTIWTQNDVRNPLASDRFAFDVLNHTDLSRDGGLSGDIDLSHINWGNYGLVVIDESHNFRNRPTGRDGESRYDKLMRDIVKSGIKTRVLML